MKWSLLGRYEIKGLNEKRKAFAFLFSFEDGVIFC